MKIALVAATLSELNQMQNSMFKNHDVHFAVHGIGLLPAAFHIQCIATQKPDLIIQCGIAGSYQQNLQIGTTVIVENELTDSGAEDDEKLLSVFDLQLADKNDFPFQNGQLPCPFVQATTFEYPKVTALTVSCSSGNAETIEKRKTAFNPDIETMEGAALHFTCLMMNIPFLQIRTISNFVEKRDRSKWDIPLALSKNAAAVKKLLENL